MSKSTHIHNQPLNRRSLLCKSILRLNKFMKTGKYLTFTLADEEFGIGILKVKEIIGMMAITSVPRIPDFVMGVINLRGKVIPVIDLRLKFGMPPIDYTDRTCIIVVRRSAVGPGYFL